MPDQAEYSSLPSLENSPVISSPKTESFSDTLIKKILHSHPDMNPELMQEMLLKAEKTNTLTIEQQQQFDTILTTLLQNPNSYNILSLPSHLKTITKDIKNNSIQGDTNLYINNLIGGQKTLEEITQTQEEQIINQKEQIINQKEQTIDKKEQTIDKKEQTIDKKEQTIDKEKKINEEQKKSILQIYEKNQTNINKERPTNLNKSKIIDQIPTQQLQVLREIFGYTNIIRPDGTKEENPEVWMMNDTIDNQVAKLVYYYVQLNNRLIKSKEPNSKITITVQERQSIEDFGNSLISLGLRPEEFYSSININFENNNQNGRGRRGSLEVESNIGGAESIDRNSRNEAPSLANDLSSDDNIDTSNLHVEGIFESLNDDKIMRQFPYPPGESISSFILSETNNAKLIRMAESINMNTFKYPLIDGATNDEKRKQIAKKDAFLRHILMANPDKKIPPYIVKKIYPDIPITDKTNPSEIQKAEKRNPRINGIRQRILNNSRNQNKEYLLQKGSLLGLMKNNFINPSIEQSFAHKLQKGYLSYVSSILKQTPGLEDIKYNPKEVIITNNKVTLPLHLHDLDTTDATITIENGKVSISNALFNPSDTNNINQITKGIVTVGTIKDFNEFTKESIQKIPELITQSTQTEKPQLQYSEQFQKHVGEVIKEQNDDTAGLQASIAHNISHNKVRDTTRELMYSWNNDGNQPLTETKKMSPFYKELHDYEQSEDKKITKEANPDTFDSLHLLRTTILRNSAQDNIIFKDSLHKLNTLITDKAFTSNLGNYLRSTSQKDETPKNSLLLALNASNRMQNTPESKQTLPLLLKLFSTQLENHNNTINTKAFQQTVDQLASGTSFDLITINQITPTNPAVEKIYTMYNKNNDIQDLEKDLNDAYE